ncbi:MAG: hypothetical protein F2813_01255 [Actinobacteria bacterium]|uniref:Unannotated protein n=1 Tax=freshwater metagenome TaxID=449393 RepID=A0A6J5Z6E7_9ZZZZ|nr:hypothetical protein [Actinomycetota bacterium]
MRIPSLALTAAAACLLLGAIAPQQSQGASINAAFKGQAMWIWQMPKTEGGNVAKIVARAKKANVTAVYVKSADGSGAWQQFTKTLVKSLRASGLRVCGWQFVYGSKPTAEARAAATAKTAGAQCLIIDAESTYEGRYSSARTYMKELRKRVGSKFALGFTSFPYVDYHPSLPYSVFLGPGGAEVNMPQVYWRDIGTTVTKAMAHTWRENRIYGRPIHPIGQTYQAPPTRDIYTFRRLASAYRAPGYSWWEWSPTSSKVWNALGKEMPTAEKASDPGWPTLRRGSKGDSVIRAQQLLASVTASGLKANGIFGTATVNAVKAFQKDHKLDADGVLGAGTWRLLGKVTVAAARSSRALIAASTEQIPRSATLPARRNELASRR